MRLTVVIPNFNGRAFVGTAIQSALAQADEVIVVDDGSTDGSAAWVRGNFPSVRLIERVRNRGFAAACNLGARAAAGEIVYLLNSDAEILPGAIEAIRAAFDDPAAFAVASLEEGGWWPVGEIGRGQAPPLRVRYVRAPLAQRTPVIFASGGHAAFRRNLFLDLGGFDEAYAPFYWEDVDLCWRAWRRGWTVALEPASRVRHAGGGSIPNVAGRCRRGWVRRRNAARFAARHLATDEDRREASEILRRLAAARPAGVLVLSEPAHLGGAEQSLWELAARLDRTRYRPIAACGESGPLIGRLEASGVPARVAALPRLRTPSSWGAAARTLRTLARTIRDEDVRIVHGNSTRANLYAWLAGRAADVKVVWHARNLPSAWFGDVEARLRRLPDAVLANSRAVAARFGGRAQVIYNGVDVDRFRPGGAGEEFRKSLGVGSGVRLVGLVGRIGFGKGHDVFLRALAEAIRRPGCPDIVGVIVGAALTPEEAPLEKRLREEARRLGVEARVKFAGWRDDLAAVYPALDVVVSATEAEPFGRVLAEAMACGRPVVAARAGGAPEVVEDGVTGLLIPPRDPVALAEVIRRLTEDPARARAMGEAGRARAERLFSADRMARDIQDVYARLLAR